MDIQFKQVTAAIDKLKVYGFRKKVYVDQENRFPYSQDYIVDQYDSFEETIHFAAIRNDEIIASIRLVMDSEGGLPVYKYRDIANFKKN